MVLFIYRDAYYEKGEEKPEIEDAEIILAKNRQGATKTVMLKWWSRKMLFFEPDLQDMPQDTQSSHLQPPLTHPHQHKSNAQTDVPGQLVPQKEYLHEDIPYYDVSADDIPPDRDDFEPPTEDEV